MHLVPEVINVDKFRIALAQTLTLFPTFAGRLRIDPNNDRWVRRLSYFCFVALLGGSLFN